MNRKGDIAELAYMLAATEQGLDVFNPFSHSTKVDVIVMRPGGKPITVQVKHGTPMGTSNHSHKILVGSAKSSNRLPGNTPRYVRYEEGDFDIVAIYLGEFGFSFWHLRDICHQATFRWNIDKPTNNWEIFDGF